MGKAQVTVKDIAKAAGVSVGTVDRALHHRGGISAETSRRILTAAAEMGYQPNMLARSLVMKKQVQVGVLLPDSTHFFWEEVRAGMMLCGENLQSLGVRIRFFSCAPYDYPTMAKHLQTCLDHEFDGIILKPADIPVVLDAMNRCAEREVALVMLNDFIPHVPHLAYVGPDDREMGSAAGQMMSLFLQNRGGGKIGIVRDTAAKSHSFRLRFDCFCRAVEEAVPDCCLLDLSEQLCADFGRFDAYAMANYYLEHHPDVVALYNDSGAVDEVGACAGKFPERAIVVVGHEVSPRNQKLLQEGSIAAVISQDPFSQGYYAMNILGDYLLTHRLPPRPDFLTRADIIVKSNASYQRRAL